MTENTEKKTSTPTRYYRVKDRDGKDRLVEATGPAAALVHAYKPFVRVATQADLIELRSVEVERAA